MHHYCIFNSMDFSHFYTHLFHGHVVHVFDVGGKYDFSINTIDGSIENDFVHELQLSYFFPVMAIFKQEAQIC